MNAINEFPNVFVFSRTKHVALPSGFGFEPIELYTRGEAYATHLNRLAWCSVEFLSEGEGMNAPQWKDKDDSTSRSISIAL